MRPTLLAAALFLTVSSTASAQHEHPPTKVEKDKPAAGHSAEHMSGWKELDAYHMVMMRVWHPAKEKGDLAPIRAEATKLADAADALARASIPTACDTPANREIVGTLRTESRGLATLAGSGTDVQVKDALKALHDRFEGLNKGCKAGHHE